ncbi:hypothetical protein GCM10007939_20060 [Amylibacter marinus]|uniref:Uncharacterized protein n=1 Tax=Amylibacter marinus TaxID=1475483 RepID=A0ABQ5VWA4_9RHOB|nr:hypothetical protein GCM10007939_20060 [Amylibacter marinus]
MANSCFDSDIGYIIRSMKQSKGGAYDYWENRAAGEGYERGARLGGSPPIRTPGSKASALLATSKSREKPTFLGVGFFI